LTYSHRYGNMGSMKTTVEIPDILFTEVKTIAAMKGITFKEVLVHSLEQEVLNLKQKDAAIISPSVLSPVPIQRVRKALKVNSPNASVSKKNFPKPKLLKNWQKDPLLLLMQERSFRDVDLLH
jgi:hypothetical protein